MGDAESGPIRLSFNPQLRVEFRGATVTSEDRRAADPARPILHAAARGKLLDRASLSSDPCAHRGAGVASDMIGPTVSQRVESPPAEVSPWTVFTSDLASTELLAGRGYHENGPDHESRSAEIGDEAALARVQGEGRRMKIEPNRKSWLSPVFSPPTVTRVSTGVMTS